MIIFNKYILKKIEKARFVAKKKPPSKLSGQYIFKSIIR